MQEVDHYSDFFQAVLEECGFKSIYYQRPGRLDGLTISYREDSGLHLADPVADVDKVCLDDLAVRLHDSSFCRQNIGLLCRLQLQSRDGAKSVTLSEGHSRSGSSSEIIVGNTHIYWNPAREDIKRSQASYMVERIDAFAADSRRGAATPVIFGGDFNSRPESLLYSQLTTGIELEQSHSQHLSGPGTRFLCDVSLIKLCKWLRLLGVDAKMESEESIAMRTCPRPPRDGGGTNARRKGAFEPLFDMARNERRVILTSSTAVRAMSACPQSHLVKLVKSHQGVGSVELALIDVVRSFKLDIKESAFLTVCGKCGGEINTLEEVRRALVSSGRAAEGQSVEATATYIPTDRPVFACTMCLQAYWWDDRSDSSPARAMRVAMKLFDLINTYSHARSDQASSDTRSTDGRVSGGEVPIGSVQRLPSDAAVASKAGDASPGPGMGQGQGPGPGPAAGFMNMPPNIYATGLEDVGDEAALAEHLQMLSLKFHARNESVLTKGKADVAAPAKATGGKCQSTQLEAEAEAEAETDASRAVEIPGDATRAASTLGVSALDASASASAHISSSLEMSPAPQPQPQQPQQQQPQQQLLRARSTPFVSAFAEARGAEPTLTNWNLDFRATLDYVFLRSGAATRGESGTAAGAGTVACRPIQVLHAEVVPQMTENYCAGATGAQSVAWTANSASQPSKEWPSDHLLVRCTVRL
jgi:uncharacterized protein with PIN domain